MPPPTHHLIEWLRVCACVCGRAQQSDDESASHFAAWAIVSSPLVLGFDLTNSSRLAAAWPTISNRAAIAVSQSWEAGRADPSGALLASWQAPTLPAVVAGCGPGCACVDKNARCSRWAREEQCVLNPGYMHAICPASCPSTANQTGWELRGDGSVLTPSGDCLDAAGQLPARDAGLNWLRTRPCNASAPSQRWTYADHRLASVTSGRCLGMMSHWLWPQPMVSLLSCGSSSTKLTLHANGTMSSPSGFGCFGVSNLQGPLSSIWRKPMAGGKTAVLAINGAALPHTITINVSQVLRSEAAAAGQSEAAAQARAVDVWTGEALGVVDHVTRLVRPHGNVFITLDPGTAEVSAPTCAFSAPDGRVYDLSSWTNHTIVVTGVHGHYNLSLCGNLRSVCHDSLSGAPMPPGAIFSMYDGEQPGTCWDTLAHWRDQWQSPTFHANGLTLHFSHRFDAHLGCVDSNVTSDVDILCNPAALTPKARGGQPNTTACAWQFAVETSHPSICKPSRTHGGA